MQTVLNDVGDLFIHVFDGFPFGADDEDDDSYVEKIKSLGFACQPPAESRISQCELKVRYLKDQGVDFNLSYRVSVGADNLPEAIVDNKVVLTRLH
jgi:hypothetical protein